MQIFKDESSSIALIDCINKASKKANVLNVSADEYIEGSMIQLLKEELNREVEIVTRRVLEFETQVEITMATVHDVGFATIDDIAVVVTRIENEKLNNYIEKLFSNKGEFSVINRLVIYSSPWSSGVMMWAATELVEREDWNLSCINVKVGNAFIRVNSNNIADKEITNAYKLLLYRMTGKQPLIKRPRLSKNCYINIDREMSNKLRNGTDAGGFITPISGQGRRITIVGHVGNYISTFELEGWRQLIRRNIMESSEPLRMAIVHKFN